MYIFTSYLQFYIYNLYLQFYVKKFKISFQRGHMIEFKISRKL